MATSIPKCLVLQTDGGEHLGFALLALADGAMRGECVFVVVPLDARLLDLPATRSLLARKAVGESAVEVVSGSPLRVRVASAGLPDLELELDANGGGVWRELSPGAAAGRAVAARRD